MEDGVEVSSRRVHVHSAERGEDHELRARRVDGRYRNLLVRFLLLGGFLGALPPFAVDYGLHPQQRFELHPTDGAVALSLLR